MDHHFELNNFAGPLDLLLHLVQKEEMDIREISLVKICDQYFAYLKDLKTIDVDTAGEFLVMAATLMSIKARSLLPREEVDLAAELDPEEELIQRLLEYRQLKEATRMLDRRSQARDLLHQSRPAVTDAGIPLEEVGLYHLVDAFRKILYDSGFDKGPQQTIVGDRPLAEYIGDLLTLLRGSPVVSFLALFRHDTNRIDLIGHFLAVLELMRARIIKAVQETAFGEIRIEAIGELPAKWEPDADLWSTQAPQGEEIEELKARQTAEEEAEAQEARSANDAELARPDDSAAPAPSGDDLPPAGQAASA